MMLSGARPVPFTEIRVVSPTCRAVTLAIVAGALRAASMRKGSDRRTLPPTRIRALQAPGSDAGRNPAIGKGVTTHRALAADNSPKSVDCATLASGAAHSIMRRSPARTSARTNQRNACRSWEWNTVVEAPGEQETSSAATARVAFDTLAACKLNAAADQKARIGRPRMAVIGNRRFSVPAIYVKWRG